MRESRRKTQKEGGREKEREGEREGEKGREIPVKQSFMFRDMRPIPLCLSCLCCL